MFLRKTAAALLLLALSTDLAAAAGDPFVFPKSAWQVMLKGAKAWLDAGKPVMTGAQIQRAVVSRSFKVRSNDAVVVNIAVKGDRTFVTLYKDGSRVSGVWEISQNKLCISGGGYSGRACSRMVKVSAGWVLVDTGLALIRL